MFRKLMLATIAAVLATPALAAAHEDEFESDWGWIDDRGYIEEYDFEGGDVSVDMAVPEASVSFETFHDGLDPYGRWVTVGAYGRVWHPAGVARDWRPYYNGRWEWTDEGWLWVSTEPWGWATYHYGRWAFDSFYGWVWVPGYQWAPAWVTWRFGVDYIGWAPLGPGLSVYVTNYPVIYDHWCFVPSARFVGVPVHTIAYVGPRVAPIYSRTQPAPPRARVNGAVAPAWGGPARPFVEKRVGRAIAPVRVQPVASPAAAAAAPSRQGVVPVYRPEVARSSRAATAPGRSGSGNALGAPGRSGGERAAPSRSGAVAPSPGRSGATATPGRAGAAAPAPGRSGSAVRRDESSSRGSAPPAAAPAPRQRSDGIGSGGGSRGSSTPRAAPAPSGSSGGSGRGAMSAPPRSSGGGSRGAVSGGGGRSARPAPDRR